jgi:histone acetyltransferase (RNA polymerase elongator complex component)
MSEVIWETFDGLFKTVHRQGRRIEELEQRIVALENSPQTKQMQKIYLIDNGGTFEGTLEQFQENFFSNADEDSIREWCAREGSTLEIVER